MNDRPFAFVLHAETIERLARGPALGRGRAYFAEGRVKALDGRSGQLVGAVQGEAIYLVSIWVKGEGLGYACTCPAGIEGDFCKHCVAVAIGWIDRQRT